jgi:hypothetical protein
LEDDFEITNELTDMERKDWENVFEEADGGDKVSNKDVEETTFVKELMQLMYVLAVWMDGDKPNKEDMEEEDKEEEDNKEKTAKEEPKPLFGAYFMGYKYSPATNNTKKVGPLNPEWVQRFFKGVNVNLVMLQPHHWWPMVVGNAHPQDKHAPNALAV